MCSGRSQRDGSYLRDSRRVMGRLLVWAVLSWSSVIVATAPYTFDKNCLARCPMRWFNRSNPTQNETGECLVERRTLFCANTHRRWLDPSVEPNSTTPLKKKLEPCPPELLYFHPGGHVFGRPGFGELRLTKVNLTAVLQDSEGRTPHALTVTIECLQGGPNEEFCLRKNPPKGKTRAERQYWPCRLFDLRHPTSKEMVPILPQTFQYNCLAAHATTVVIVRATVFPQGCQSVFYLKVQTPSFLEPSPAKRWEWLPMVSVGVSPPNGVMVGFTEPPSYVNISGIRVKVFKVTAEHERIEIPKKETFVFYQKGKTGVMLENMYKGAYELKIYPEFPPGEIPDDYEVDEEPPSPISSVVGTTTTTTTTQKLLSARISLHGASITFHLDEDHVDPRSSPTPTVPHIDPLSPVLIAICFTIIVVVMLCAFMGWMWMKYVKRRSSMEAASGGRGEVVMTRLENSPTPAAVLPALPRVLIIYSDDNIEHRKSVEALASLLRSMRLGRSFSSGEWEVLLDEWALNEGGRQMGPDQWYYNALGAADLYIVLFSLGAREVFNGRRLSSHRHWDDWFSPAMTFVLQQLLADIRERSPLDTAPLKRYIWLRMSYSADDSVPPFVRLLPVPRFLLPTDAQALLAHTRKLARQAAPAAPHPQRHRPPQCTELQDAIERAREYQEANPQWLRERLQPDRRKGGDTLAGVSADLEAHLTERSYGTEPTVPVQEAFKLATKEHGRANGSVGNGRGVSLLKPDDDLDDEKLLPGGGGPHISDSGAGASRTTGTTPATAGNSAQIPLIGSPDDLTDSSDDD